MTSVISENLPLLAGAPNGIQKLRQLVFELAASGKLADGATDVKCVPLCEVASFVMGQAPPGIECNKNGEGQVFVKTGEFGKLYPEVREWTTKPLKYASAGDVLICVVGATVGKLNLGIDCAIGRSVAAIRPKSGLITKYLYFTLMPFTLKLREQSRGSAQGVIGKSELSAVNIRFPSESEQHRIVAKVEELMALCDRLEAQQADAESAHAQLVQALLDNLTQASDATDFAANWQRLTEHFNTLFTTESSIDALKKTLLQLAVMGKLAPQDPCDEPASELLARLAKDQSEYAALHKVAVTKREPISASDLRLPLPDGWEWARLCSMFRLITDGDHQSPPKSIDGVAFLTIGNVTKGSLDFSNCRFVPQDYFDQIALYRRPEIGDILYTVVGATYGRPIVVDSSRDFCVQRHIAILKSSELLNSTFASHLLSSPWVYDQATQSTTGTAQPTIPLRPLRNFRVMLPPLPEQHRIVAKVDQLMTLCDQLKTRLTQARHLNEKLASTLVEQVIN